MLWTFDQFLKIMLIQTYNIYIVIYVSGWSDCCYNTFHVKLIWPFCSTYYLACRNIWWKNNLHGGGDSSYSNLPCIVQCPMHGELVIHFYPIVTIWNSCEYSELLGRLHVLALFSQILTCVDLPPSITTKNNVVQVLEDRPSQ